MSALYFYSAEIRDAHGVLIRMVSGSLIVDRKIKTEDDLQKALLQVDTQLRKSEHTQVRCTALNLLHDEAAP